MKDLVLKFINTKGADADVVINKDGLIIIKQGSKVSKGDFATTVSNVHRISYNSLKSKNIINSEEMFTTDYVAKNMTCCGILLAKAGLHVNKKFKVKGTNQDLGQWKEANDLSKPKRLQLTLMFLEERVKILEKENEDKEKRIIRLEELIKRR